ncbi:52 kDa repressor of the inhibitor of the protein kinase-like [Ixodes scapularis]|uniref:52 kDa repressor of the inhibitor of the protein kinase-like n=1 Tax=Ixodes scapularis TaxID=6945 RepID=UPI001C382FDD|nr:52 kDa repressor of the inhibitor of the protein kinase-like [Ixodes scapularis]
MPSKRAKSCFVPNCNRGYQSCKEKVPLFRAPKDAERLEAWSQNIKRADRTLDSTRVVCAKHFEEQYIEKTFKQFNHIVNGKLVQIQRDRPLLKDDAVPTIFPSAPSYFTRSLPKKRKTRDLCHQLLPPRKRKRQEENCEAVDIQGEETSSRWTHESVHIQDEERSSTATQRSGKSQFYRNLHLPTSYWSKIVFEDDPFSVHRIQHRDIGATTDLYVLHTI